MLYCAHCGSRMYFNHNVTHRKLADGGIRDHENEVYRCYRRLSHRKGCSGPPSYKAEMLNKAVDKEVRDLLSQLEVTGEKELLKAATGRQDDFNRTVYQQAEKKFQNASRQVTALEEEAVKALTGESQLDLSVVNEMLLKHKARLAGARQTMEEARQKIEESEAVEQAAQVQVHQLLTWADRYDRASVEEKHIIISHLVERIEIGEGYQITIQFKVAAESLVRKSA